MIDSPRPLPKRVGVYLDVFPRRGRNAHLIESIPIPDLSLDEFRALFDLQRKDEIVECFEVTESQRDAIESRINRRLDLKKQVCCISASAENDHATGPHIHDLDWELGGLYPAPRDIPGLTKIKPGFTTPSLMGRLSDWMHALFRR